MSHTCTKCRQRFPHPQDLYAHACLVVSQAGYNNKPKITRDKIIEAVGKWNKFQKPRPSEWISTEATEFLLKELGL